ncbi:MAG: replicative DNA helicase [Alphaproteobacteria bacterium]|jgi:replicative DNA helicase|nr:replicative DNA helicase [Alphaproteobacteria bacterium]MDG1982185.1 replicative DNA helicase [Alphaproteobacteria bacterium]MDG2458499.1 replicative DNA helicase [Alphaproteobacteria bacterium]|tara:strand:+ start:569 stop:2068 length:1500 start_codon:yes stop_codon:yes gene_type:complete
MDKSLTKDFSDLDTEHSLKSSDKMPQNIEAEQSLIGSVLFDNKVLEDLPTNFATRHFFDPLHASIFDACIFLIDNGRLADPLTLKSYLKQDDLQRDIDIEKYLSELREGVVSLSKAKFYAEEIRNCYVRRSLIRIGDELINKSVNPTLDVTPDQEISNTEEQLYNLAEKDQINSGPLDFKSVLASATNQINEAYNRKGKLSGIDTGFSGLNRQLGGLNKSDLLVLAGRPAMGKTALATNIGFNAAKSSKLEKNESILIFSLEMSAEQLAQRILAEQSTIDSHKLRSGDLNETEFSKLVSTQNDILNLPFFIDDTPAISVGQIASRARRLKRTHGLSVIIIDYIQLIQGSKASEAQGRVQEVSNITRGLKSLAKELNVPILALSQLSRAVEQREDKRPILADLRESGSIEQDADVVMFVYREEYYLDKSEPTQRDNENQESFNERFLKWQDRRNMAEGKAEIIISKQRHGPTGIVQVQFEAKFTRFMDLVQDDRLPDQIY